MQEDKKEGKSLEDEINLALKLAANSDAAVIRHSSISHPHVIMIAKDAKSQETCLHLAEKSGCYCTCKWSLPEANVKVDCKDKVGRSPLHAAAIGGKSKVTSLISKVSENLIECWAADVNGRTPIDLTMEYFDKVSMSSVVALLAKTNKSVTGEE